MFYLFEWCFFFEVGVTEDLGLDKQELFGCYSFVVILLSEKNC